MRTVQITVKQFRTHKTKFSLQDNKHKYLRGFDIQMIRPLRMRTLLIIDSSSPIKLKKWMKDKQLGITSELNDCRREK